jgi:hypothetical protein
VAPTSGAPIEREGRAHPKDESFGGGPSNLNLIQGLSGVDVATGVGLGLNPTAVDFYHGNISGNGPRGHAPKISLSNNPANEISDLVPHKRGTIGCMAGSQDGTIGLW